ncbi:MAG: hypothetical protein U0572_10225 [Phycisphaerales bacterium]
MMSVSTEAASAALARRYALAAAAVTTRGSSGSAEARMRAVVDSLWEHLSPAGVSWVGFYLPVYDDGGTVTELVLGPSRNTPACSPIGLHGVCGRGFLSGQIQLVRDVAELGSAYVACDPRDRAEVVVPVFLGDGTGVCGDLPVSDSGTRSAAATSIARSTRTQVGPCEGRRESACVAVLDLDSHSPGRFGPDDVAGLRRVLGAAGFETPADLKA